MTTRTWLACAVTLISHQVGQKALGWRMPLLDNHLDPFLGVPVLLGLAQAERRFVTAWLSTHGYPSLRGWRCFTALEVAAMTVVLALIFEGLFPYLDPRQTRDPLDVAAVVLGGCAFYVGVNHCDIDSP